MSLRNTADYLPDYTASWTEEYRKQQTLFTVLQDLENVPIERKARDCRSWA